MKNFGCLKTIILVAFILFLIGLFMGEDETSSNSNDNASFTCSYCREIFVDTNGNGLIIWNTNSIGECTATKFYGGSKTGYCTSRHCEFAN